VIERNPRRGRLLFAIVAGLMLGGIMGYGVGYNLAVRPLEDAKALIERIQPESQKLKATVLDQEAKLIALQSKFTRAQSTLDAIMPTENTYKFRSNQSLKFADGQLTIGLVGSHTNESITININGKQQQAVTGDIFKIAPNSSTTCQVGVQAFDMFNAILMVSCAAVKSQ
jgi:hypothetical protein